jgi:hypothetical protein
MKSRSHSTSVPEWVVQAVWAQRRFDETHLRTTNGQTVTVFDVGRLNRGPGPDFRDARLAIGDRLVAGDVEIHLTPGAWRHHGHQQDPRYNGVVLHVVLAARPGELDTRLEDGSRIPIAALRPVLHAPIGALVSELDPFTVVPPGANQPGRCFRALECDPGLGFRIGELLDEAGDARMRLKARRFRASGQDPEGRLIRGIAEVLGYPRNRHPMSRLVDVVDWSSLMGTLGAMAPSRRSIHAQAVLLYAAGFPGPGGVPDEETQSYLRSLDRPQSGPRLDPLLWTQKGRPLNSPIRRVVALAALAARVSESGWVRAFELSRGVSGWEAMLTGLSDPYWDVRSSVGGPVLSRRAALVGRGRARGILANAVIPAGLSECTSTANQDRWMAAWHQLGRMDANRMTKWVRGRMFGGDGAMALPGLGREIVRNARRQQGLVQLARDVCLDGASGCSRCFLAQALPT